MLRLRYGLGDRPPRTLAEIGRQLGLSRERIRQIESKALKKVARRTQTERSELPKSYGTDEKCTEPSRAYEYWTDAEDQELAQLHDFGLSVSELSTHFGRGTGAIQSRLRRIGENADSQHLGDTHTLTLQLLERGLSIPEIVEERGLSQGTVMAHIERIAKAGKAINLAPLLPPRERRECIEAALHEAGCERLAPVKEILGDDYSYDEIRLVRLAYDAKIIRGE